MEHKTTRKVPARTEEVVEKVTCDICGADVANGMSIYDQAETTVKMEQGTTYPDSGDMKYTEYDICCNCFKEKLMPFLASLGAQPRIRKTDW